MKHKRIKTGGRQSGTPNVVSGELREWIKELLDGNRETFERDLQSVEPAQRLLIMDKLMSYVLPKMQAVDATSNGQSITKTELIFCNTPLSEKDVEDMRRIQEYRATAEVYNQ